MEPDISELCDVLMHIESREEAYCFLKDICTPQEIKSLTERWRVCRHLENGNLSYREIHTITGASLTTIGRVARFLRNESYNGYRTALKKLKRTS